MKNSAKNSLSWMLALALVVSAFSTFSAFGTDAEEIHDARGTIRKVGNFGYGIVPDADPGTRYAPVEELAEEFCEDGLRVLFSGKVGSADEAGGRRWGTPLEVTSIERLAADP